MLPSQVGAIDSPSLRYCAAGPARPGNKDFASREREVPACHAEGRRGDRRWVTRSHLRRVLSFWLASALMCVVIAAPQVSGQSKGRKKKAGKSATAGGSPGEQSLTNIPLPIGHEAKGLVLPDFDPDGRLRGKFEAGTAHRIDQEHVGFQHLKITTYTPESQPDLRIDMSTSVLDLNTRHQRMKKLAVLVLVFGCAFEMRLTAQIAAAPAGSPVQANKAEKPKDKGKARNKDKKKEDKSSGPNLFGSSPAGLQSDQPTTTEIYSDEAFFDSTKNMGIFSGRVKVVDPRFNLQSEKLTVLITKGENQSLEKAIAEGNVGLIRDRPDPNGGPPTRAVGRADKATYTANTGDVELMGTPREQEGPNLHVATSPDTVMVIGQNSQLRTHGPSRTQIVQQPSEEKKGQANPSQTPATQASPAPSLPKP